jgi:hypothetical protein
MPDAYAYAPRLRVSSNLLPLISLLSQLLLLLLLLLLVACKFWGKAHPVIDFNRSSCQTPKNTLKGTPKGEYSIQKNIASF